MGSQFPVKTLKREYGLLQKPSISKMDKINWFISWTMFMWFCVSPNRGYLYFKEASSLLPDFEAEAVICIMTTIFGGFYFFWNIDQIRPDGISLILAFLYSAFMLVN